jgi:hypothetical protein
MKIRIVLRLVVLAAIVLDSPGVYPCAWATGYFHQLTCLRGSLVGTSWIWPRWVRQRFTRGNVDLRLFEYRWPLRNQSEMPFVKEVRTDASGNFDFGALQEGHYTLVIDWPSEFGDRFDIEIKKLPKSTSSVRIDVSPANPDCTGGHTIDVLSE